MAEAEAAREESEKWKDEVTDACDRENRMMSMVIHSVGLEIMKINRTLYDDKSWMIRRPT